MPDSFGSRDTEGRVVAINTSAGGVPKAPVIEAAVTPLGLEGDSHRNMELHGGPDRAVILFSLERINDLIREGHPIATGATGENLTIASLNWNIVIPGVELMIGPSERQVRLLITKYTTPCAKIRNSFLRQDQTRISQKHFPGWSRVCARVVQSGVIHIGDSVFLL